MLLVDWLLLAGSKLRMVKHSKFYWGPKTASSDAKDVQALNLKGWADKHMLGI